MITLDENCGMDFDMLYLIEEASNIVGLTVEEFVLDCALDKAGKVLAKAGDSCTENLDELSILGQELQPEEYQMDLFGEQNDE